MIRSDRFLRFYSKFVNLFYSRPVTILGVNIFGIIIVNKDSSDYIINHEKIHTRQYLETLFIGFILIYFFHFLINLIKYRNSVKAYFNICFEKEAYKFEKELDYLKTRKLYSWLKK